MTLNEERKENFETRYSYKRMDMYNNIAKLTHYFNNIETDNNVYLGKKRELEKQNNFEINLQNQKNSDKNKGKIYYNINKYNLNSNKTEINNKIEYDYNYYLFKSKRVNLPQKNIEYKTKPDFNNNYQSNNDKNQKVNDLNSNSINKESKNYNRYITHGINSVTVYHYANYIGDYSYFDRHLIGNGSFGQVFCGIHRYRKFRVAIKLPTEKSNPDMIDREVQFTRKMSMEPGFPMLFYSSVIRDKYVMVESLLGPSLDKLFLYCGKSFPMKTICLIGIDIVKRLRSMHKNGLLHRDLKPNNFTWGNYSKNYYSMNLCTNPDYDITSIYLIDFGLSESYIDPLTGACYKNEKGAKFIGTLRYSSVNSHKGIRQCRKDDLESMMYILIYFYKGKLPWQDVKSKKKEEKHMKIKEEKLKTTVETLCKDMPKEFERMLCYIKSILYSEEPNYEYLLSGFQKIIQSLTEWENVEMNYNYIWEKKLHDDLKKKMFSTDEEVNKKINDNIGLLFKGYPSEIRRYMEKISFNESGKIYDTNKK